jgi:hypothetical protein
MVEPWRDEAGKFLFHYTAGAVARQIAEDEHYFVGSGAAFGFGLYATDLRPEDADPEEIRAICFGGDSPDVALDGVLVLLGDDRQLRFEEVEPGAFLLPAEEGLGEIIPLHPILIGIGQRKLGNSWEFESWP